MLTKTKGIVLHTTDYSESSIIARVFTDQFGLQSYLVNSVRSRKAKAKSSLFQPLTLADMVVYHRAEKGLQRISEISAYHFFTSIPYDITKSAIAIFLAEALYRSVKENEAHPHLYHFAETAILYLDMHQNQFANYPVFVLTQMTRYLGNFPLGQYTSSNCIFNLHDGVFQNTKPLHSYFVEHEIAANFSQLLQSTFDNFKAIKISHPIRIALLNMLVTFYELHHTHGTKLKSHLVLKEVMDS